MRDQDESPGRERWEGGHDDLEGKDTGKHRSTDKSKDHRSRDRDRERAKTSDISKERDKDSKEYERDRVSSRSKRKESRDDHEKDRNRDKARERDSDRDKYREKDRAKEKERERVRDTEKDRDKEREKHKDRDIDREKGKDRTRDKEVDKERPREKDSVRRKGDDKLKTDGEDRYDKDNNKSNKHGSIAGGEANGSQLSTNALAERILKSKEERLKRENKGDSDVLAWVSKSRKLEEKRNIEKEKALQLSRVFEEQDDIIEHESDDEAPARQSAQHLSGVKVLHGLDKVIEGGAVVLTLKDQSILANGDINEEVDMLENVEIGEQKQRTEAYKAAKKKTGIYDDKFNDDPSFERNILPQYDDPIKDEGVTLDAHGQFSGAAEKKLEELRKRLEGGGTHRFVEDLTTVGNKTSSEYYTHEEMLKFQKPKKKKSLRKKEKLDVDALTAEAVSAGLGTSDLGSRNDSKRKSNKAEQDKIEAEKRMTAYQSAYARADEASKALKLEEKASSNKIVEESDDDAVVFDDDDEDLRKSLDRARRVSLKKKEGEKPSIAFLASYATKTHDVSMAENDDMVAEPKENTVVFTEMEEFVWGLQLDEEAHKPDGKDVFMDEDPVAKRSSKDEDGGWSEVNEETKVDEKQQEDKKEEAEEITPDETIHEAPIGKGLSGALKLWKDRGALGQGVEWGGRNMDKKKSKVAGIYESDGPKEIRIERTDEYGRILTPKEAFRLLSHKFHGKGPGKTKQEKRIRQREEEQKVKQMSNSDTPSMSAERMRETQERLQTPYLVLSGSVRPGQTSDPRSGFATVEKDFPGGLTPMLGDRKVEYFLGMKGNHPGDMGPPPPKKPKQT